MKYYSIHFNRPDFISIQKKYIKDAELIILNNGCNPEIRNECKKLNIQVIDYPDAGINSSYSHGHALNYIKNIIDYSDDYCIIDHDFFPFKNPSFHDYDFFSVSCHTSKNIYHMWPGFIAGKKGTSLKEVNFLPEVLEGGDTGCDTNKILKQYKVKFLHGTVVEGKYLKYSETIKCPQNYPFIFLLENFGIHYLNGSNWFPTDKNVIEQKNELLISTLEYESRK